MTRRDFLKLAGLTALLAYVDWEKAIKTFAETVTSKQVNIVWFESQSCTGDTTSLLEGTDPSIVDILLGNSSIVSPQEVVLAYSDAVMPAWGERALSVLKTASSGNLNPFVLVVEGSFPIDSARGGPPESDYLCYIGEENNKPVTCTEWFRRLASRAAAIVTVGTCSSYGGIPGNAVLQPTSDELARSISLYDKLGFSKSPTGSVGILDDPIRKTKGILSRIEEGKPFLNFLNNPSCVNGGFPEKCRPIIAVPGCPANGNAIIKTLASVVLWYKGLLPLPALDNYGRPIFIYGPTTHDQCPRAGSYAAGDFRKNPGDDDYRCLFALGCKGPVSHCPWNKVGWINGVGGPTNRGAICIGCTNPGFSDSYEPFFKPLPAPEPLSSSVIGAGIIAGLAAGALAGYGTSKIREKAIKRREEQLERTSEEKGEME